METLHSLEELKEVFQKVEILFYSSLFGSISSNTGSSALGSLPFI